MVAPTGKRRGMMCGLWLGAAIGLSVVPLAHGQMLGITEGQSDVEKSVQGADDRQPVGDTSVWPWSAVGLVRLEYGNSIYIGTGVLVDADLVLTAGHVVARNGLGSPDEIVFIPGAGGGKEPFGRAKVVRTIVKPEWNLYGDENYDLALLVLDRPIGEQAGTMQVAVQPDGFFDGVELWSAGYPTDKGVVRQYWQVGKALGMKGNRILSTLDTVPGQSGSPVWYEGIDGSLRVVGVLKGSNISFGLLGAVERTVAPRIDANASAWLVQYIGQNNVGTPPPGDGGTNPGQSADSFCGVGATQSLLMLGLMMGVGFVSRRCRGTATPGEPRRNGGHGVRQW